jgi:acetyl-CoA carboxylase beta subunit
MRTKKFNALDLKEGRMIIDCKLSIICPICKEEVFLAYLRGRVAYCKKCKKVFEIIAKESKISYQQLKDDGWVK